MFRKTLGLLLFVSSVAHAYSPSSGMMPGAGFQISSVSSAGSLEGDARVSLGTSLRTAAREGRMRLVREALAKGADVNAAGEFGETALMYAARFNRVQAVELLLKSGARVNERDSHDRTALMHAAYNCSHRVAELLLVNDANPNLSANDSGRTPLMEAAENGCSPFVARLLKEKGLDVNAHDDSGNTALDLSAREALVEVGGRYTEIVTALLAHGAEGSFLLQDATPKRLKLR